MKYYFIFFFIFCAWNIQAQSDDIPLEIEAIVGAHEGNVILRWAPSNERSWLNWSNSIITIHRRIIDPSESDQLQPAITLEDSLKAWTVDDYQKYADNNSNEDSIVMLAGYLMHSPYETTQEEISMQNMVDRKEELSNRYSSALYAADVNSAAANALAWRFVDEGNIDSEAYYTISVNWGNNERTTKTIKYSPAKHTIPQPLLNRGKEKEEYVVLSWDQRFHKQHFTAYWIERSKDNKEYIRLNKVPFVHAFDKSLSNENDDFIFSDSIPNYTPYYYRIIGISPFGIESSPSQPILLQARDKTPPPAPQSVYAIMKDADNMSISWQSGQSSDDLAGYIVKKDYMYDGEFSFQSALLPKNASEFIDSEVNYLSKNYYMVCAVDTANNEACSLPVYGFINDTIPPSVPKNLTGTVDSSGVVVLRWDHNKEIDLKGYHVYFANREDGVFSKITPTAHTYNAFTDTLNLNTLTEDIYYSITAEDIRSNVSYHTEKLKLAKPDTIPPGPGTFKSYKSNEKGIEILWSKSGSRDAVKQELWRKTNNENNMIWAGDMENNSFIDTTVTAGASYAYSLITYDDSNLSSQSPGSLIVKGSNQINTPIVSLDFNSENNRLSYSVKTKGALDRVIVYRSQNGGPFITYKTFQNPNEIIVENPKRNSTYKVIAITNKGIKSDPMTYTF